MFGTHDLWASWPPVSSSGSPLVLTRCTLAGAWPRPRGGVMSASASGPDF